MAEYVLSALLRMRDQMSGPLNAVVKKLKGLEQGIGKVKNPLKDIEKGIGGLTKDMKMRLGVEGLEKINRLKSMMESARQSSGQPINIRARDDATSRITKLRGDLAALTSKAHNVIVNVKTNGQEKLQGIKNSISGFAGGAAMGAGATILGTAGMGYGAVDVVKNYKDFDYQMRRNKALFTTGLDVETANMQYKELEKAARHYGSIMKFTATEVAKAEEYMALAGWDAPTSIKALPSILNAAVASGEDLALVSDIITDDMTAMGYKAGTIIQNALGQNVEAAQHFSDVMLRTTLRSNTNFQQLGLAMKYAAPLAHTLGYNIEDVAVAMGLMANNGIKADQAGTGLRGILNRFISEPKKAAKAIEQLGVSLFDAQGHAKSLMPMLMDVRAALKGKTADEMVDFAEMMSGETAGNREELTEFLKEAKARGGGTLSQQDQAKLGSMLSGTYAMAAFMAIMNSSDEDIQKLMTEIYQKSDGTGAAISKEMLDTLQGDLDTIKSAWEDFNIELMTGTGGDGLRNFIQGLTSDINHFKNSIKDGLDFSDIASLAGKVIGQLKNKFLELDGIGSILAGGALMMGLRKLLQMGVKVKDVFADLTKIKTAADVGKTIRGKGAAGGLQSVGAMNIRAGAVSIRAGVVNVHGAVKGGGIAGGKGANTAVLSPAKGTGRAVTGIPAGVGGRTQAGRPPTVIPPATGVPSAGESAFKGGLKAAGGAGLLAGVFGALDYFSQKSYNEQAEKDAANAVAYQKAVLAQLRARNAGQDAIISQVEEIRAAEDFQRRTLDMSATTERRSLAGTAGSVSGAMLGAGIGSILAPGFGTLLGGMIGDSVGQVLGVIVSDMYAENKKITETGAGQVKTPEGYTIDTSEPLIKYAGGIKRRHELDAKEFNAGKIESNDAKLADARIQRQREERQRVENALTKNAEGIRRRQALDRQELQGTRIIDNDSRMEQVRREMTDRRKDEASLNELRENAFESQSAREAQKNTTYAGVQGANYDNRKDFEREQDEFLKESNAMSQLKASESKMRESQKFWDDLFNFGGRRNQEGTQREFQPLKTLQDGELKESSVSAKSMTDLQEQARAESKSTVSDFVNSLKTATEGTKDFGNFFKPFGGKDFGAMPEINPAAKMIGDTGKEITPLSEIIKSGAKNFVDSLDNLVFNRAAAATVDSVGGQQAEGVQTIKESVAPSFELPKMPELPNFKDMFSGITLPKIPNLKDMFSGFELPELDIAGKLQAAVEGIGNIELPELNIAEKITTEINEATTSASAAWANFSTSAQASFESVSSSFSSFFEGVGTSIQSGIETISTSASTVFETLNTSVTTSIETMSTMRSSAFEGIQTVVMTQFESISMAATTSLTNLSTSVTTTFSSMASGISGALAGVQSAITSAFESARSQVQAAWGAMPGFFSGVFSGLGGAAAAAGSAIYSGLTSVIGSVIGAWQSAASTISSIISSIGAAASSAIASAGAAIGGHAIGTSNFEGGLTKVNEHGGELIVLPSGNKIYPYQTTQEVLNQSNIAHNAKGTSYFKGGWSEINRGSELKFLPQGTKIYTHATTQKMLRDELREKVSSNNVSSSRYFGKGDELQNVQQSTWQNSVSSNRGGVSILGDKYKISGGDSTHSGNFVTRNSLQKLSEQNQSNVYLTNAANRFGGNYFAREDVKNVSQPQNSVQSIIQNVSEHKNNSNMSRFATVLQNRGYVDRPSLADNRNSISTYNNSRNQAIEDYSGNNATNFSYEKINNLRGGSSNSLYSQNLEEFYRVKNSGINIAHNYKGTSSFKGDLFCATDIAHNYKGTSNFAGGFSEVNEHGGELMFLPNGTRIVPHATTQKILRAEIHERISNGTFSDFQHFDVPEYKKFINSTNIAHNYKGTSSFVGGLTSNILPQIKFPGGRIPTTPPTFPTPPQPRGNRKSGSPTLLERIGILLGIPRRRRNRWDIRFDRMLKRRGHPILHATQNNFGGLNSGGIENNLTNGISDVQNSSAMTNNISNAQNILPQMPQIKFPGGRIPTTPPTFPTPPQPRGNRKSGSPTLLERIGILLGIPRRRGGRFSPRIKIPRLPKVNIAGGTSSVTTANKFGGIQAANSSISSTLNSQTLKNLQSVHQTNVASELNNIRQNSQALQNIQTDALGNIQGVEIPEYNRITTDDSLGVIRLKQQAQLEQFNRMEQQDGLTPIKIGNNDLPVPGKSFSSSRESNTTTTNNSPTINFGGVNINNGMDFDEFFNRMTKLLENASVNFAG